MIDKIALYTLCAIIYVGTAVNYADTLDIDLNRKCDPIDMLIVILWPIISICRFIKLIDDVFKSLLKKVKNCSSRYNKTH
jgi:hypothetical protein